MAVFGIFLWAHGSIRIPRMSWDVTFWVHAGVGTEAGGHWALYNSTNTCATALAASTCQLSGAPSDHARALDSWRC